jgi:hypothetical protein
MNRARLTHRMALGLTALAAFGLLAATTSPAGATAAPVRTSMARPDTYGTFYTSVWASDGVFINSSPGGGTRLGLAYPGQTLTDYCYTTGPSVNGDVYWDLVTDNVPSGATGYITEYYLNDDSQTKHC